MVNLGVVVPPLKDIRLCKRQISAAAQGVFSAYIRTAPKIARLLTGRLAGCNVGTVTMWTPNSKEPQMKMLCHGGATRSVAVDATGRLVQLTSVVVVVVAAAAAAGQQLQ